MKSIYLCKIKFVRNIFLILAVSIVFIHNSLPHQHHKALDTVSHTEEVSGATSLLEFLQLGFHLDIGNDHLANFEKAEKVSFSFPYYQECIAYSFNFVKRLEEEKFTDFNYIKSFAVSRLFWHEISFRGPPTA